MTNHLEAIGKTINRAYGFHLQTVQKSSIGAGSDTYFVTCDEGKYVLKFPADSGINHPEQEPRLCTYLLEKGLPVCQFIKTLSGGFLAKDETGRLCTLQSFIEGTTPAWNTASDALLWEQAEMLGRIHAALQDYPGLPTGIGAGFFDTMTPQRAKESYQNSLRLAKQHGNKEDIEDLAFRIRLTTTYPGTPFDYHRLSFGASHGDYFISQLLCEKEHIRAVIDWTCACVHPLVWELVRSYVYASPECADGFINEARFAAYMALYEKHSSLPAYDKHCAKSLYLYQIAVCDYYGQYYTSAADNREIYLAQAHLATKLLRREFPNV